MPITAHLFGVVFYNDITMTKIIALTDININGLPSPDTRMPWLHNSNYEWVTGATVCYNTECATNDINGKYNTNKILEYASTNNKIATSVTSTNLYAPPSCSTGTNCATGNWYLPSLGEIYSIYLNWSNNGAIYHGINLAGGSQFINDYYYWTSTEWSSTTQAWGFGFSSGYRFYTTRASNFHVRPALQISAQ